MRPTRTLSLALVVLALTASACQLRLHPRDDASESEEAVAPGPLPSVTFDQSDEEPPHSSVSATVQRVLPSVVNVRVTAIQQGVLGVQEGRGEGSGVVIDRRGIIVTNNHVIQDATEVTVVPQDGRRLPGRVIGGIPERDLAVIKVDADDLTPIELGDSSKLRLGDEVIAIGFPLGLGPTVTKGIVSAENRRIPLGGGATSLELSGLIQTDAAINPGNSGGALVDLNGRLVGINTAAAGAGFAENVGFAININSAIPVIQGILEDPPEERAWLGVFLGEPDSEDGLELGVDPDVEGALIIDVIPGSPAEDGNLKPGDVVTSVEGTAISGPQDLIDFLIDFKAGQEIDIEWVRGDEELSATLTLAPRPASFTDPTPTPTD